MVEEELPFDLHSLWHVSLSFTYTHTHTHKKCNFKKMNLFVGLTCSLVIEHLSSPSISLALGAIPKPTNQTTKQTCVYEGN